MFSWGNFEHFKGSRGQGRRSFRLNNLAVQDANRKMETDWRQKELPEQLIIQAGRKADGFDYFRLQQGHTPKGGKLVLEAESLETKEKIALEVLIVSGF